jgi:hypothetical protein
VPLTEPATACVLCPTVSDGELSVTATATTGVEATGAGVPAAKKVQRWAVLPSQAWSVTPALLAATQRSLMPLSSPVLVSVHVCVGVPGKQV